MSTKRYNYEYLWRHPQQYKRLTRDDLNNNEAIVDLCEIILLGVREEVDHLINELNHRPGNQDVRDEAKRMYHYLLSDELSAMSFGGSVSVAEEFKRKCPKGVIGE